MLSVCGKYCTVYNPCVRLNVSENILFADITSSSKDTRTDPPTYIQSRWSNVAFVGDAFEPAKGLVNGDKINILRGSISNVWNKQKNKAFLNITVYEFEMSDVKTDTHGEKDTVVDP